MDQLEKKSGVSRTTIYRQVGTKDKILSLLAQQKGEVFEKTDIRQKILAAARIVFTQNGLSAATIEQVSKQARVGVATIYRHFGDKETLLQAFVEEITPRMIVRDITLHPTANIRVDLEAITATMLPFFIENRDLFKLIFKGNNADQAYLKDFHSRSSSTLQHLTDYFKIQLEAKLLKKTGTAEEIALAFLGLVLAFAVIGPLYYATPQTNPKNTSKLIVNLFLNDLHGDQI